MSALVCLSFTLIFIFIFYFIHSFIHWNEYVPWCLGQIFIVVTMSLKRKCTFQIVLSLHWLFLREVNLEQSSILFYSICKKKIRDKNKCKKILNWIANVQILFLRFENWLALFNNRFLQCLVSIGFNAKMTKYW